MEKQKDIHNYQKRLYRTIERISLGGELTEHNSTTLKELSLKGLISCINPEDRSFKFYKITKKGKEILKEALRISEELE